MPHTEPLRPESTSRTAARRLATFVHVSDTHISEICDRTGDGVIPEKVRKLWFHGQRVNGKFGHSWIAMRHLQDFYAKMRAQEGAHLVHTGDLTALGHPEQFRVASDFFRSKISCGSRGSVGLDDPESLDLAIPGNHDHWPGTGGMLGRSSPALSSTFERLPLKRFPLASGHSVLFAGIDTCADVGPWGAARAFARGCFTSQLRQLGRHLKSPRKGEFRVLLLHHSPQHERYHLGITSRSRAALDRFITEHKFRVLLTGHVHSPKASVRRYDSPDGAFDVLEARSGPTLHRDHCPEDWPEHQRHRRRLPKNTLMVHRVYEKEGELAWQTRLHVRGENGFHI